MIELHPRYMVNEEGQRVAVVLDLDAYNKLIEELEELEDIRAYDEAKASGETAIPIEQALSEIERKRK